MNSQLHILLVDDSKDQNWVNGALLRSLGCSVSLASSEEEAFAAIGEQEPDIMIVDYSLPQTTGPEVIRRLREKMEGNPICVILTGHDPTQLRLDDSYPEVRSVLQKPVSRAQLEHLISGF